jgi:molybdate transport system ATP-binding protein
VTLDADLEVAVGDFRLRAHLRVEAGETVAVVGPNGAGKTTLLRALAGLLPVDDGRVTLGGRVLDDTAAGEATPPEARSVGVVFQDHRLFPHLTARDDVAFGLRCRGVPRAEAARRADDWLARVGLADHARSKPRQLSGGQAQRVALARALATEPDLLLLDEPLSALDATTREATRRDLRRHLQDHPGCRLLVTHDPVDAAALADRIVVLERGEVSQEGTLAELTAAPRSPYVADLVGVNLLRGRARPGESIVDVDAAGLEVTTAERAEGDVLLTVPPRAVTLSRRRPEGGTARNVWPGTVDAVARLGDRARVGVRVGTTTPTTITVVAEVTTAAADDLALAEGSQVFVAVKATEIGVSSR